MRCSKINTLQINVDNIWNRFSQFYSRNSRQQEKHDRRIEDKEEEDMIMESWDWGRRRSVIKQQQFKLPRSWEIWNPTRLWHAFYDLNMFTKGRSFEQVFNLNNSLSRTVGQRKWTLFPRARSYRIFKWNGNGVTKTCSQEACEFDKFFQYLCTRKKSAKLSPPQRNVFKTSCLNRTS